MGTSGERNIVARIFAFVAVASTIIFAICFLSFETVRCINFVRSMVGEVSSPHSPAPPSAPLGCVCGLSPPRIQKPLRRSNDQKNNHTLKQ